MTVMTSPCTVDVEDRTMLRSDPSADTDDGAMGTGPLRPGPPRSQLHCRESGKLPLLYGDAIVVTTPDCRL